MKPEKGLLDMRASLNYANLRPCLMLLQVAAAFTLKEDVIFGVDIVIFGSLLAGSTLGSRGYPS
jgi:hypothetical protein